MRTATESDRIALAVGHGAREERDFLLADGGIDHIAELEELLLGKATLLTVINQPEGIHHRGKGSLMQLQVPAQKYLQSRFC